MKIQNLVLHNFRAFENLEIEFNPQLTVIVGQNGVGKTTILEAAAIAAGTLLHSLDGVSGSGIKRTDAHYKYFEMGSVIDVQAQYPVEVTAVGKMGNNQEHVVWTRALNSENGKTTVGGAREMIEISKEYQERLRNGDTTLTMPVIAYYGTGRLWDTHREKRGDILKKNTRTNGYIDSLDGMPNVKLMLNWFQRMAMKDGQRANPSLEFAAVRGAMEKCFSLLTGTESVQIQLDSDTLEIMIVYLDEKRNWVRMPLNQMSDGYRCTLSLIADIAYRMATLNPQLSENILTETDGVVLIDEIDLHLHPAWQQRVLSDLTNIFPKVQFIVTTHAPAVINSVKSENLVILKDYQVEKVQSQVYGKNVKSVLNEIMGATERPPEVAKLFDEFYAQLARKEFDSAQNTLDKIYELRENHDEEVASCMVKLKLERIRGKK